MPTRVGKVVGKSVYIHRAVREQLPTEHRVLLEAASTIAQDAIDRADVFRLDLESQSVSALSYPGFFEQPFPELRASWRINAETCEVSYRSYDESLNPPILHRKELLLAADDPRRGPFEQLTLQGEAIGLFGDPTSIGFKRVWEDMIRRAGYEVVGHSFQPLGNEVAADPSTAEMPFEGIQRYRTALSRTGLSAPMQALARHGFLDSTLTLFDYGCGRGDDVAALRANGLDAQGWDPHFAPTKERVQADVVNLGFVINVIEDRNERVSALRGAYALATRLLVVSTMLYGSTPPPGRPYGDGFLTQRSTFQKYFTQAELKEFIESAVDADAIPVAPGIMFVFADKHAEQSFLYGRQRSRHALRLLGYRREKSERAHRLPRETRDEPSLVAQGELLERLWQHALTLGRVPQQDEFADAAACIAVFGKWGRMLRFLESVKDASDLELAARQRTEDLLVYLALQLFSRRKSLRDYGLELQRDIKAHFGDYQKALSAAQQRLLEIASPALLHAACTEAASKGLGYYAEGDYLQLHASLIERLPALLRIYIGCGTVLYGDLEGIDLVKIHIRSGKLTLMKLEDFEKRPLPRLLERVKIKLREQDIDFFVYGTEYEPPLLYFKSRYIGEDFPRYEDQLAFDKALAEQSLFDPKGYGLSEAKLLAALEARRLAIEEFRLCASSRLPGLDEPCGEFFTYRDFVECGETWHRTLIENLPKQPDTFTALYALASNVLDPVIDYFGMVKLTYGFASAALTKTIEGRIAPNLDQHAGHEVNRRGKPICARLGAAVDFIVEDEDMVEVAKWITQNIPFDRLYVYGPDRPLHVSYGPERTAQVVIMQPLEHGNRRVPKALSLESFQALIWSG